MDSERNPNMIKNKMRWLDAHRRTGIITATCEETGIGRTTVYDWMNSDPDFAQAKKQAEDAAIDMLEAEARRRAFEGIDKPIYHQGKKVDTTKEYSDTLLMFVLKAKRPEYRDRVTQDVNLNGAVTLTELIADE